MRERLMESDSIAARNHISELPRLSEFLSTFFARNALSTELMSDFELALEEVFVNVVRYGYPEGGEHEIGIRLSLEDQVVELIVEDDGVPFNPLKAPLVDLNLPLAERGIGGLGLHLVKGVMDELGHSRVADRNRLVMR
ncbi:MAG: ATP-binding protein, partial [Acidobacteriota bacterium]